MPIFKKASAVEFSFKFLLSLVFFVSGVAGLVYQVVWQRALSFHFGVGPISTTVVVTVFMLGLGIGGLLGGRLAEQVKNRVLLYFGIELGLAVFGFFSLSFIQAVGKLMAGQSYLVGFFFVFLFLCIPTCLMGMTLPLIVKIFNSQQNNFFKTLSLLYFINTLGAAFGALLGSYVFISFYGLDGAIYFAAAMNLILAVLILFLTQINPSKMGIEAVKDVFQRDGLVLGKEAYVLVFVTGFLAIGYQMIWFRVVNVIVKSSPYAFSSTLFVYLLGIAVGSYAMNHVIKNDSFEKLTNRFYQINSLIAVYVLFTVVFLFYLSDVSPIRWLINTSFTAPLHPIYHPNGITRAADNATLIKNLYVSFDILLWPAFLLFVPTVLMGASFPVLATLSLYEPKKEAQGVANIYWWNIVGNVIGGFLTGFVLLPILGTEWTIILFVSVGFVWLGFVKNWFGHRFSFAQRIATAVVLVVFAVLVVPKNGELYLNLHTNLRGEEYKVEFNEGVDGIVLVEYNDKTSSVFINGLAHGARPSSAFNVEISELVDYSENVTEGLVIGFGGGNITDLLLRLNDVDRLTVVELSDTLIENIKKVPHFQKLMADKRLNIIIEDGRRFLMATDKKFDVISMDPLRSTTSYSNNLYSKEFFELVRSRLKDKGVLMAWMNEYMMIPKTIASVFENVRMYYFFLLASKSSLTREGTGRKSKLMSTMSPKMLESMKLRTEKDYFVKGGREYVFKRASGYPILTDLNPWAEYYVGLNLRKVWRIWPDKKKFSQPPGKPQPL